MSLVMLYIKSMIGYMMMAMPFYVIGRLVLLKKKQLKVKIVREILLAMFVIYSIGLASQTIIPNWHAGIISDTGEFYFTINTINESASVNLIPFKTLYDNFFQYNANVDDWSSVSLLNISANMLLFLPLGILVPLIWRYWRSFRKVLILGVAVTCCIEIIQSFIGRSMDIDDVILNTVGVMIGYSSIILLEFKRKYKYLADKRSNFHHVP
ncbi:VanZ family protein [Sutcliffiella halmapala]|uniref:VanZ family protein n=1 Tax=Sutcliffiella halmapala TaxID=79882 RepID=UPI0009954398|nr:VanZ family protein [Sutcliffiella halmapala]